MSTLSTTNIKHPSSASNNVVLDSSGRVGVNTATPTGLLDVYDGTFIISKPASGSERNWRILTSDAAAGDFAIQQSTTAGGSTYASKLQITNSGNLQFNSGYGSVATAYGCRAWVNFDGTSGSIGSGRANGNVSSITDNGTGDYTVNFSTAMPDTNYCMVSTVQQDSSSGQQGKTAGMYIQNTGSCRVTTGFMEGSPQYRDCLSVFIAIFR